MCILYNVLFVFCGNKNKRVGVFSSVFTRATYESVEANTFMIDFGRSLIFTGNLGLLSVLETHVREFLWKVNEEGKEVC